MHESSSPPAFAGSHFGNLGILRFLLATLVVYSHSYPLTNQGEPIALLTQTHTGGSIAVQAFFLISGYLVTQSLRNSNSLPNYFVARFLRIWPALACALFLTIFCAWISSDAAGNEFLSGSYAYLKKNLLLIAGVSYELPGAFANNPTSSVNGSLWTLPWEIRCYLLLVFLWCLGLLALKRHFFLAIAGFSALAYTSTDIATFLQSENPEVPWLIGFFIAGASAQIMADRVRPIAFSVALCTAAVFSFFYLDQKSITVFLIASITFALGFSSLIRLPNIKTDLSYGIYIYAFPIQQLLVHFFPSIAPLILFFTAMLILIPVSAISWFWIEKPSLALKKPILMAWKKIMPIATKNTSSSNLPGNITTTMAWGLFLIAGFISLNPGLMKSNEEEIDLATYWGVFYPMDNMLYLRHYWSSGFADGMLPVPPGSMPLLGKWHGDHVALGSFDASKCEFLLHPHLNTSTAPLRLQVDCTPSTAQALSGDWNGDGITDIGLFTPENSEFRLWVIQNDQAIPFHQFQFGQSAPQSIAITGDWDGDGVTTIGLWHAPSQQFLLTNQLGINAGMFLIPARTKIPATNAMPFSIRMGGVSKVGLHFWQEGSLLVIGTEHRIHYGKPGTLGFPVFE